jgi:hypothetical protein
MRPNDPLTIYYVVNVPFKDVHRWFALFPLDGSDPVPGLLSQEPTNFAKPEDVSSLPNDWMHVDAFLKIGDHRTAVLTTVRDAFWWHILDEQLVRVWQTFEEARPHLVAALNDPRAVCALPGVVHEFERQVSNVQDNVASRDVKLPRGIKLYEAMIQAFNLQEIEVLCFKLGIPYDDLEKGPFTNVVISLIQYCERRQKLKDLADRVMGERPHIDASTLL